MTSPSKFTVALANETATANLMADLALLIGAGDVITLSGDLGAGKTAAARALIRYVADDPEIELIGHERVLDFRGVCDPEAQLDPWQCGAKRSERRRNDVDARRCARTKSQPIGLAGAECAHGFLRTVHSREHLARFLGEHLAGRCEERATADALDAKVSELARTLCQCGPEAVKASKRLVQDVAGRDISPELIADTVGRIADIRASAEGREGIQSFLDKRKPNWLG